MSRLPTLHRVTSNWCDGETEGRVSFVLVATGLLSLGAAESASLEAGSGRVLNVLLGGDTDHELGDVDHLLSDSDVLLADEDAGVVDGGGELALDDEGLESALEELSDGETEDVIELALGLLEETKSNHAADKGLA